MRAVHFVWVRTERHRGRTEWDPHNVLSHNALSWLRLLPFKWRRLKRHCRAGDHIFGS